MCVIVENLKGNYYTYTLSVIGVGRAFIEGLRTDSLMIGSIRVSQGVSLILIAVGIIGYVVECRRRKDNNVDWL